MHWASQLLYKTESSGRSVLGFAERRKLGRDEAGVATPLGALPRPRQRRQTLEMRHLAVRAQPDRLGADADEEVLQQDRVRDGDVTILAAVDDERSLRQALRVENLG